MEGLDLIIQIGTIISFIIATASVYFRLKYKVSRLEEKNVSDKKIHEVTISNVKEFAVARILQVKNELETELRFSNEKIEEYKTILEDKSNNLSKSLEETKAFLTVMFDKIMSRLDVTDSKIADIDKKLGSHMAVHDKLDSYNSNIKSK